MVLEEWAIQWGVPYAALHDLRQRMRLDGGDYIPEIRNLPEGEAGTEVIIDLEASRKGVLLWKNSVGALEDINGRMVRYGLANRSKNENKILKSADRIGCRPELVQPHHVGQIWGRFVSRELKEPGWRYTGTPREVAQLAWANLVLSAGGDACFATGEGTL